MSKPDLSDLTRAIVDLDEAKSHAQVSIALGAGADPTIVLEAARAGMSEIGDRFARGEAFLPELLIAGEIMADVAAQAAPLLQGRGGHDRGCIVLGTVEGDIHDIGKNLVATQLVAAGFEVVDLGVDVAPETFASKAGEIRPVAVALSCLLTVGFESMKRTVAAVRAAVPDGSVQVMVGGGAVNESVCGYCGADGWGGNVAAAVRLAEAWSP
jgi:5-methyltetrahydrofolate--homocysteine methyltransferase